MILYAFEKMAIYLGVENYDYIPIILEKMEIQMETIEMVISKLSTEEEQLEVELVEIQQKIVDIKVSDIYILFSLLMLDKYI